MTPSDIITWSAAVITVGGAIALIGKFILPLFKEIKRLMDSWDHFTRDWFGESEAQGRDKVPGVMERLNRIDGELKHNGGSSMKDSQRRIEKKLTALDERLEEGNRRFERIEEKLGK
jgi:hypothetical protein